LETTETTQQSTSKRLTLGLEFGLRHDFTAFTTSLAHHGLAELMRRAVEDGLRHVIRHGLETRTLPGTHPGDYEPIHVSSNRFGPRKQQGQLYTALCVRAARALACEPQELALKFVQAAEDLKRFERVEYLQVEGGLISFTLSESGFINIKYADSIELMKLSEQEVVEFKELKEEQEESVELQLMPKYRFTSVQVDSFPVSADLLKT